MVFDPAHHLQRFCAVEHQGAFHRRNATRGKKLLPLALMGLGYLPGEDEVLFAETQMHVLLSGWAAEDKREGRRPELLVQQRMERAG